MYKFSKENGYSKMFFLQNKYLKENVFKKNIFNDNVCLYV